MRLLKLPFLSLVPQTEEFLGESVPKYAILSHTWGDDEVSLQEFNSPTDPISTRSKKGYKKILNACAAAIGRDLEYTWVDTCCIDKTSSAELTEAINSMYAWYAGAQVCYAYLSDLKPGTPEDLVEALPKCRWFSRGWTLQELIAPREVIFFDREWNERGNKNDLSELLCQITGIPAELLKTPELLEDYSVARRMSWASRRRTTRIEDLAYCLLGIFDVNLALIYGEGKKAFKRLQEAIVLSTADRSIFLWTENRPDVPERTYVPILAEEPFQFADCGKVSSARDMTVYRQFTTNTRGLQVQASLTSDLERIHEDAYKCIFDPHCTDSGLRVCIAIRKIGDGLYARYKPGVKIFIPDDRWRINPSFADMLERRLVETITLATKIDPTPPFPGPNVVVGNRSGAIRLNWLSTPFPLSRDHFRVMPRTNWDYHDEVFFASTTINKSWCAFLVRGVLRITEDSCIPIHVLGWCGYWNIGIPKVMIASLHDRDPVSAALLEANLENTPFETCNQVHTLLSAALDGNIPKLWISDQPILTAGTVIRTMVTKGDRIQSLQPPTNYSDGGLAYVKVNASVDRELRPDICTFPMWRMDISCEILEAPLPLGKKDSDSSLPSPCFDHGLLG